MQFWRKSIIWSLLAPIPLVMAAAIAFGSLLPGQLRDQVIEDVRADAIRTVAQFKTIRGYYTQNVVKKLVAGDGPKPAIAHRDNPNAVPLPATMIHDLSELMASENMRLDLYSAYPFPNRADRKLDAFQREAWDYLSRNPDQVYTRVVTGENGERHLRMAAADQMSAQACVSCHNSYVGTPKNDWKLGDV